MRLPGLGLLREPDYRMLFASTTVSQFGAGIAALGIPLVAIVTLQASAAEVGVLAALSTVSFLLGLPAGAWVDRMRRRSVLVVADLGRAAVLATVPLAWWAGMLTIWQLYAVALMTGVFRVFFDVAYQSYLPHLVGRDNLVEGNAKLESVRALARLGGPALAGQLIRLLGAPVALMVDAAALALSAIFVARIRKPEQRPARSPDAHLLREIDEGLRFVLGHRLLRPIATCTGIFNLFFAAYSAMLILFLQRVLELDAGSIGLVFTIFGAGGLLGAFTARRMAGRVGQGPVIWMSTAFTAPFGLLMPLLAEPGWKLWIAAAGGTVFWAGIITYNIAQVSFRQRLTPDHLLGRANATIRFLVWGVMPIGALLGGVLGELIGVRTTLLVTMLAGCTAFLPVVLSPLRTMRTLPTEPEPEPLAAPGTRSKAR
jgi:MFS family permease